MATTELLRRINGLSRGATFEAARHLIVAASGGGTAIRELGDHERELVENPMRNLRNIEQLSRLLLALAALTPIHRETVGQSIAAVGTKQPILTPDDLSSYVPGLLTFIQAVADRCKATNVVQVDEEAGVLIIRLSVGQDYVVNKEFSSSLGLIPGADAPVPPPQASMGTFAGTELVEPEKIIGVNSLRQIAWIDQGVQASRSVCRVLAPNGLATGFLIGPNTLMTNNHVIASEDAARQTRIEFNYQLPFSRGGEPTGAVRYDLDPDALFHTSAASELDYTIVAVSKGSVRGKPEVSLWGTLFLNPNADPVRNEHVVIIQHPNGQPKQVAMTANAVVDVRPPHLYYSTDTMPGSSGSPVFNDLWEVIAIHHAAGPCLKTPGGSVSHTNEGVLMSAIRDHMGSRWPS